MRKALVSSAFFNAGSYMSKVCQLFSGSSGNSIYIESKNTKILVDAGVSSKRIENALS